MDERNFTSNGQYFMVRCYKCKQENYMPAVATGQCVWCGEVGSSEKELDHKISELVATVSHDSKG